jgi:uncharacterized protein YbjT (DUF2867 family)
VGRPLVQQLLEAKAEVVAITRDSNSAGGKWLARAGATVVQVSEGRRDSGRLRSG